MILGPFVNALPPEAPPLSARNRSALSQHARRVHDSTSCYDGPPSDEPQSPFSSLSRPRVLFTRKDSKSDDAGKAGGFFGRLKAALGRTRSAFVGRLSALLAGRKVLDEQLIEDMETVLLSADVGIEATQRIMDELRRRASAKRPDGEATLDAALREAMVEILAPVCRPLRVSDAAPFVILMVGVNGTGKTTSAAKLAHRYKGEGRRVLLAAGDTFRAAAIEQLQTWGERLSVPVIAQHSGADSAAVIYDALSSARARGTDLLIADTAGRLHTQSGLMEELKKVRRVIKKLDPDAPHETLLVIDASTGQNALVQARQFTEAVEVSGLVLTKLDGTAKGGIIFAIAQTLRIPIRFVGVGEGLDDLRDFDANDFVDALLEG